MKPAEESYSRQHAEAMLLLEQLRENVENLPAPEGASLITWGHVGSLRHVNNQIREVLEFINPVN